MGGRTPDNWHNALEIYLTEAKGRVVPYTMKKYRWSYTKFFTSLEEAGLETNPSRIGEREIRYLLNVAWAGFESSTRKWYASIFSMILQRFGNDIIQKMHIRFPQDARTNVDWLTPDEMITLLDSGLSPLEEIVIHLELCLGLRNIETKRLRLQDVKNGYLEIRGKGTEGGKWRTVPFHPDTSHVIEVWMAERNRMIAEARRYRPNIIVPDNLIIWKRYIKKPQIGAYAEESDGLTSITTERVRERLGIDFANHTLRRTFGRSIWLSDKVQTETISQLYGHADTKTTLLYIGVNLDDMSEATNALSEYQNNIRKKVGNDDRN